MKLVTQLLERLQVKSSAHSADHADIGKQNVAQIIHDALASAGLGRGTTQGGQIAGVIDDALARAGLLGGGAASGPKPARRVGVAPLAIPTIEDDSELTDRSQGRFLSRSFASPAGNLAYKLYVPASYEAGASSAAPLIVMLHGCTQSPDDFAAGTRMNVLAEVHGFLVAYPVQSAKSNANKCWNWFRPQDQARGSGEPALIAGMTAQIGGEYRVDPTRIYVAGLSAGAAMAVVLGRTYPDVFAGVGAHSGLAYRAAHDMGSAFAAMKGGATRTAYAGADTLVPTIVFHGDRDHTVSASNSEAIIAQLGGTGVETLAKSTDDAGTASSGLSYTRTRYTDSAGRTVAEDWRVNGGGHAWMGGSASGSYTDPQGPDASAEMVRFFLQHARSGS